MEEKHLVSKTLWRIASLVAVTLGVLRYGLLAGLYWFWSPASFWAELHLETMLLLNLTQPDGRGLVLVEASLAMLFALALAALRVSTKAIDASEVASAR